MMRFAADENFDGMIEISQQAPIGQVINDVLLVAECAHEDELDGRVLFLPF